jgi:hypothetical protein
MNQDALKYRRVVACMKHQILKLFLKKLTYDKSTNNEGENFEDALKNSGYRAVRLQEGYYDPLFELMLEQIPPEILVRNFQNVLEQWTFKAQFKTLKQLSEIFRQLLWTRSSCTLPQPRYFCRKFCWNLWIHLSVFYARNVWAMG